MADLIETFLIETAFEWKKR